MYGPTVPFSEQTHEVKYRQNGESFEQAMNRIAGALSDGPEHEEQLRSILLDMRFLPAGRVQCAMGATRRTTPYNCFVSDTIPDDMDGIMRCAAEAAETMRRGGGIGYDFSTLRPKGDLIRTLESQASGPVSFMNIFDAVCGTICSAGHRRGAQMAVLRVDHPDIEEFIHAKTNNHRLTQFNVSVGVTDEFMRAVERDGDFDLKFDGRVYRTVKARELYSVILANTWDWAEPGILFIDRINKENNLWYAETIAATNPCGEQPLPPYGACLLGSWNLTQYIMKNKAGNGHYFNLSQFQKDIPVIVRAMDNVIDRAEYPLEAQKREAKNKRRMGLGFTGVANALEILGTPYGSPEFLSTLDFLGELHAIGCYSSSIELAKEKGSFPFLDRERFVQSGFMQRLPSWIRDGIEEYGIRNSHLLSIAPTGTISLCADNVSSGIEPVFALESNRIVQTSDGPITVNLKDYAYDKYGHKGRTTAEVTIDEHLDVLKVASKWVDSAVSKTCNVGDEVTFAQFKDVYTRAWKDGAKGCTTFRLSGKRFGIMNAAPKSEENEGGACYIDAETGVRTCDE